MYSRPLKISERKYLLGLFLNGLKDKVRAELKLHSFNNLEQLMNLAKMVESSSNLLLKSSARGRGKMVGSQGSTRSGGTPFLNKGSGGVPNAGGGGVIREEPKSIRHSLRGSGYRQLSDEEYKGKRVKGLCFACDE